jgi:hypothetical protein
VEVVIRLYSDASRQAQTGCFIVKRDRRYRVIITARMLPRKESRAEKDGLTMVSIAEPLRIGLLREGENMHALSFEELRGWFPSTLPQQMLQASLSVAVRACTQHDA